MKRVFVQYKVTFLQNLQIGVETSLFSLKKTRWICVKVYYSIHRQVSVLYYNVSRFFVPSKFCILDWSLPTVKNTNNYCLLSAGTLVREENFVPGTKFFFLHSSLWGRYELSCSSPSIKNYSHHQPKPLPIGRVLSLYERILD